MVFVNGKFMRMSDLQSSYRAEAGRVWRAHKAGEPLTEWDRILAHNMARHPEWTHFWEHAEDLGDAELQTETGVDPFGIVTVETDTLYHIGPNGSRLVREAYHSLLAKGLEHFEAIDEIALVFLAISVKLDMGQITEDEANERLGPNAWRRLAAGEMAAEIFPEYA